MGLFVKLEHKHLTVLFSATAIVVWFAFLMQPARADISTTKHNLGSTGTGINHAADTAEICVFCHLPDTFDSTGAPIWNKLLPTNTFYTTYADLKSGTLNGTIGRPGANSLFCLSCHDGAQAMDNMINAPGSSISDPTGGGANGRGYTWTGADQVNGKLINAGGSASMLGTDLANDHPIGIEYCGGPKGGLIGSCKDAYFIPPTAGTGGDISTGPWWVDTSDGAVGVRESTDMILYAAAPDRTPGIGPQVECGSCHDPHSNNPLFLRRMAGNLNSITCLSCHIK